MPLTIDNELKIVFNKDFYTKKHILWGGFEDGRVVDASEIASKISSLLNEIVHVKTDDVGKRKFTFYTKTATLGTIYFGKPEESYVTASATLTSVYSAVLEKIFKTISADGEYPIVMEIVNDLENPSQISINVLPKEYLKTHENIYKNIVEYACEITSIPRPLLEDLVRRHSEYGVIAVFKRNGRRKVLPPTFKPPKHNIPLLPKTCPIGFIVGYSPNLSKWLILYYDPIGYYGVEYYEVSKDKFKSLWKLKFMEKEELGTYRLAEVEGNLQVEKWMNILNVSAKVGSKLEEVITKDSFSVEDPNVFSAFFIVPVRRVSEEVEECEIYIYSRYWGSPKLIRTNVKHHKEHGLTGLMWIREVNLTPSMKWLKTGWKVLSRISLITACVLSVLKS